MTQLTNARLVLPRRKTSKSLRNSFEAYLRKTSSPNLTWGDLLGAISAHGAIAEDSALLLHEKLSVRRAALMVNTDRNFWLKQLRRHGQHLSDKVRYLKQI
jgi:hypothetical protein